MDFEVILKRFFNVDYAARGAELHAANYAIDLGGKVKLTSSSAWIAKKSELPTSRHEMEASRTFVDALDLSRTVIKEEGISNFG